MDELPGGPFDKDVIDKKNTPKKEESPKEPSKEPLSEKNFIHESPRTAMVGVTPLWIWVCLIALFLAIIWGSLDKFQGFSLSQAQSRPFLEVTNRQFSVFLWQFPSFMRSYAKQKTGYLPGFKQGGDFTLNLSAAEDYVVSPPELLFLYHTWNRLLSSEYIPNEIKPDEFTEFLNNVPEWKPQNWKEAPEGYKKLVDGQSYLSSEDLQKLPETTLPIIVRQAFQGWKNYFKEGAMINLLSPTIVQVQNFIKKYPNYARNFWRNIKSIDELDVAGNKYLLSFLNPNSLKADELVPSEEIPAFLRVALFNAEHSNQKR